MINPNLRDKVVLITGANHGIGAATAQAFAVQGAKVFIAVAIEPQFVAVKKSVTKMLLSAEHQ